MKFQSLLLGKYQKNIFCVIKMKKGALSFNPCYQGNIKRTAYEVSPEDIREVVSILVIREISKELSAAETPTETPQRFQSLLLGKYQKNIQIKMLENIYSIVSILVIREISKERYLKIFKQKYPVLFQSLLLGKYQKNRGTKYIGIDVGRSFNPCYQGNIKRTVFEKLY